MVYPAEDEVARSMEEVGGAGVVSFEVSVAAEPKRSPDPRDTPLDPRRGCK